MNEPDSFPGPDTPPRPILLMQTVGTGGDKNPVWEALALTITERRPSVLIFLASETSQITIPKIEATIPDQMPPLVRTLICKDQDNVENLINEYRRCVVDLKAEFPQHILEMDYTSGTKAMSAAAVAVAVTSDFFQLHYAIGPRDSSGRAYKTDRISSISTLELRGKDALDELGRLFDLGQFVAVEREAMEWKDRLGDGLQRSRAITLHRMARVYAHWDRFDWNQANNQLNLSDYSLQYFTSTGWNCNKLRSQKAYLEKCKSADACPQQMIDLFVNAQRCVDAGYYDDAVARLYRLTEFILQKRFALLFGRRWSVHQSPTTEVSLDVLKQKAPNVEKRLRGFANAAGNVNLGLMETWNVIGEAVDPVVTELAELFGPPNPADSMRSGPLNNLLGCRNRSFLAHGVRPVKGEDAKGLLGCVERLLSIHAKDQGIDLVSELGTAEFHRCPWLT